MTSARTTSAKLIASFSLLFLTTLVFTQNIEEHRIVNWSDAGLSIDFKNDNHFIHFTEHGGDPTGQYSNSSLLQEIINEAEYGTTIYLDEGTFYFEAQVNLKSGVSLQGASSQNTKLVFDLNGNDHCLSIRGALTNDYIQTTGNLDFKSDIITVTDELGDIEGEHFLMVPEDQHLVTSDWAIGNTGQVIRVAENTAHEIKIESELRRDFTSSEHVVLRKINPIKNVWISDLTIERLDATITQKNNILIDMAYNSGVSCIKSYKANFAHISVARSHHVEINSSFFKDGFSYGTGGKAYGIALHVFTSQCKVFNNSFEHLRHSMLLQAGANGNVIAYNYSRDPYWEANFLAEDSAGEIVLHGNYPYANLIEGNIVGNIVVDDSHGENGPNNTFFRNRADNYGFFTAFINPTHKLNLIGNEVKNTEHGLFSINGNDHTVFANVLNGDCEPIEVNSLTQNSLYLEENPFESTSVNWPVISYPNDFGVGVNQSLLHTENGEDLCTTAYTSHTTEIENTAFTIFPNPTSGQLEIVSDGIEIKTIIVLNQMGQSVFIQNEVTSNQIDLSDLSNGMYRILIVDNKGISRSQQVIVQK